MENSYTYIFVIALAWFVSHLIKSIIEVSTKKRQNIAQGFFASGGMPSAHTATVVALTVLIGLNLGFTSAIFTLAGLFSIIIMHDAMRVRWSTGENTIAINKIIKDQKLPIEKIEINRGHTLAEVIAGGVLGTLIAVVVYFTT